MEIHPTATIDKTAQIGQGTIIGPNVIVGKESVIGENCHIMGQNIINEYCQIGNNNVFYPQSCIGFDPQDLSFDRRLKSGTKIGDNNIFREFVTIHRATIENGFTTIGSSNYFMVNTHVAHDCVVEDNVIMTNNSVLAGHVHVEKHANISAYVAVHQFCRVGSYSMIGAFTKIVRDIIPFCLVDGNPPRIFGQNLKGLERAGFSDSERIGIIQAIRTLYFQDLKTNEALNQIELELPNDANAMYLVEFVRNSRRGIV